MRYTCEQNEGMDGYGWESYDPRTGGVQVIHDKANQIDITTEFVKFPEHGSHGGSWGARIKGTPRADASSDLKMTAMFSIGVEGMGSLEVIDADKGDNDLGFEGDLKIAGETPELGEFTFTVTDGDGAHPIHGHQPTWNKKPLDRTLVHSIQAPQESTLR